MSGEEEVKHSLEAMAACTKDDIVHWNWSIELVNSQVENIGTILGWLTHR